MSVRTLGIVGYGQFGRFIETLAKVYAPELQIRVWSRSEPRETLEDVCQSDVVVIAVSIRAFADVLPKVLSRLGPNSVVVEVNTVKEHPVNLLRKTERVKYVATHPMFGPYSFEKQGGSLKDLKMVIADHTLSEEEYTAMTGFLAGLGLSVLSMTPEAHDRMLAETLFLTHYIAQSVAAGGFVRTDIDTLSFGYLMDAVESVRQDTELFKDVYAFNPYCKEILSRLKQAEDTVQDLLEDVS